MLRNSRRAGPDGVCPRRTLPRREAGGEILAATADMANSAARTAVAVTTGDVPDESQESGSKRDRSPQRKRAAEAAQLRIGNDAGSRSRKASLHVVGHLRERPD